MCAKIAIPIEAKTRELYGKLWLSLNLIRSGNSVVLGPSDEIKSTLDITEPDIYIAKDTGDGNEDFFKRLKNSGVIICGLHTEGAIFSSWDQFTNNQKETIDLVDHYFAWASEPAKQINKIRSVGNTHITGNPRFDILKEELNTIYNDESKKYKQKYGDYIIINTTLKVGNHSKPEQYKQKRKRWRGSWSINEYTYESQLVNHMCNIVHRLNEKDFDINIIFRPHFVENSKRYQNEFANYENVHVIREGDVRSWMAGAKAIIHRNSTTGIEAALMDKPVISTAHTKSEKYDKFLPNYVSENVYNIPETIELIEKAISDGFDTSMTREQKDAISKNFYPLDGNSAENICDIIKELDINNKSDIPKPELSTRLERILKSSNQSEIILSLYDGVNRAIGNDQPAKDRAYRRSKFPGLSKGEVVEIINKCNKYDKYDYTDFSINKVKYANFTYIID